MIALSARLIRLDVLVQRNYLLAGIVAIPCLEYLERSPNPLMLIATLGIIVIPGTLAYWIVGNDRSKGTVWFIASLPVPKASIPWARGIEVFLLSATLLVWTCLCTALIGREPTQIAFMLGLKVLPLTLAISFIATSVFFVVPYRVGFYVNLPFIAAVYFAFDALQGLTGAFSAAIFDVFVVVAIILSVVILAAGTTMWSKRMSPAE